MNLRLIFIIVQAFSFSYLLNAIFLSCTRKEAHTIANYFILMDNDRSNCPNDVWFNELNAIREETNDFY